MDIAEAGSEEDLYNNNDESNVYEGSDINEGSDGNEGSVYHETQSLGTGSRATVYSDRGRSPRKIDTTGNAHPTFIVSGDGSYRITSS
jgi:hypothetical protein